MTTSTARTALLFFVCLLFTALLVAQPANDEAANAIPVSFDLICTTPTFGTLTDATPSGTAASMDCSFGMNSGDPADVFYTFTVPDPLDGALLSVQQTPTSALMLSGEVFTTDATPVYVECFSTFGGQSFDYDLGNLTPGETYLLRLFEDATQPTPPGVDQDFLVCLHGLPTLETGNTFGNGCNDAVELPDLTASGEWRYVTVNDGVVLGILDNEALTLTDVSLDVNFGSATGSSPYGTVLTRVIAANLLSQPANPLRVRFFFPTTEFQAFLDEGFSASELLTHRFSGLACTENYPAATVPAFSTPVGFGKVGEYTVYLEYEIGGFSTFFFGEGDASLPVSWETVTATAVGKHNRINWSTLRESGADYFAVERLADAGWQQIARLAAIGDSEVRQAYSAKDMAPPLSAVYRVRQVDRDGEVSFTPMVEVTRQLDKAYPNPVADWLRLPAAGHVTVRDAQGRSLLVEQLTRPELWVATLPPGVYVLTLDHDGGHLTQRLVKH